MSTKKLSPEMQAAVALAKRCGGRLHRHPGGYWAGPVLETKGALPVGKIDVDVFGTQTVKALMQRRIVFEVSAKRDRAGNIFTVEVELASDPETLPPQPKICRRPPPIKRLPTDSELLDWFHHNFFLADRPNKLPGTTAWEFYAPAVDGHNDVRELLARAMQKQKGKT